MQRVIIAKDEAQLREVDRILKKGGFDISNLCYEGCSRFVSESGYITQLSGRNVYDTLCYASDDNYDIITADQFLENPKRLIGWEEKPSIEITVKINGKETSPSEISEETWNNIRNNAD